jgi:prepilin-type N-terminal cleavage/methylation domain-containing protein
VSGKQKLAAGRSGYTLLEVVLAIAIGLLLIAALYVALDVQMRYMQAGRNAVAEGQLARGLLARIGADIRMHLGKLPSVAALAGQTSVLRASGTDTSAVEAAAGTAQFNYGLQGDESQLVLFVSAVTRFGRGDLDGQYGVSDLRRIVYTLVPGTGLVRIESRAFSTDPNDMPDAVPDVLAPEVVALQFRYFDGASGTWLSSWDGSSTGPPLAVEVVLGLQPPVDRITHRQEALPPSSYRLVVTIPSAVASASGG